MSGPADKVCQVVEVSTLACPCYVIEAEPGFYEDNRRTLHDMSVHEVFDRRAAWGKKFLEIVDRGLTSVCYQGMRTQLDRIAKKKGFTKRSKPSFNSGAQMPSNMQYRAAPVNRNTKTQRSEGVSTADSKRAKIS